jgi:hypothetical protein
VVRFDARCCWGLAPVSGTFERVRGTLTIDPDGSCAAALRAEAAGIRTRHRHAGRTPAQ